MTDHRSRTTTGAHSEEHPELAPPGATSNRSAAATTGSRVAAVVRAGHDGDLPVVRSALGDSDAAVRAAAVSAVLRITGSGACTSSETTAAVLVGLHDADPTVRRRSADVAARWADATGRTDMPAPTPGEVARIGDALVALLDDSDARVVEVAAFACGELYLAAESPTRHHILVSLGAVATGHPDPLCRESAVASLGAIGDPAGLEVVLHACRDRANVRRRAVLALAAFDGPAATAALHRLLEDRDLQVRQAAEELLAIESGEST